MENKKEVVLPIEVVNGVLNYLATKPYHEVANLIKAVEQTGRLLDGSPIAVGSVPPQTIEEKVEEE